MNELTPDRLIGRLMTTEDKDGTLQTRLLMALHNGYPAENLRALLHSERESAVRAGVWLLSELGSHGRALVNEVPRLLSHPSHFVRYLAVDSLTTTGTRRDGAIVATAIAHLGDDHQAVRTKVMEFMGAVSTDVIEGAIPHLQDKYREPVVWLLRRCNDVIDVDEISDFLDHDLAVWRKVAAVAALRVSGRAAGVLEKAARSSDEDVCDVAMHQLKLRDLRRTS